MSHIDILANDTLRNLVMPVSVAQYHTLCASGLIPEKTELIEGLIFRKMTKSPIHEFVAHKLYRFFSDRLDGNTYLVRKEAPLTLASSEPEPDISIIRGRIEAFVSAHPDFAELVIEVAVSSSELDREKAAVYANAGIPEYWIVYPNERLMERYGDPSGGHYKTLSKIPFTRSIDTLCGELKLEDLLAAA